MVGNLVHISIGKHDYVIFLSHITFSVVVNILHFTEAVQENVDVMFPIKSVLQMKVQCNAKKFNTILSSLICKLVLRYSSRNY